MLEICRMQFAEVSVHVHWWPPPKKKLVGLGFYFFQNVVYRAVVVFVVSKILSGLIQQIFMTSSGSLIKAVKAKEAKYWLGNTQLGKRIPSDAREIQLLVPKL